MKKSFRQSLFIFFIFSAFIDAQTSRDLNDSLNIYHMGWIDFNKNGEMDIYENPNENIDRRIQDLLGQMTLEEKTCQTATLYGFGRVLKDELPTNKWLDALWKDGIANIDEHLNGLDRKETTTEYSWPPSKHAKAINEVQKFFVEKTRLGIPVDFTNEGIRGICQQGATSFPSGQGLGSSWDEDLIYRIGTITGIEAKALGYTNVYSPILDLARDPRWGRVVECYSEDPYLVSRLGLQQVKALQNQNVVSTPKHFAVYSVPKGGRDGDARTDPHVAPRELELMYLTPFKTAFVEGKALGTMSSYNDYDGVPITGSSDFLIKKLREEWGFKGYVVSDSKAVEYIYTKHHVAVSPKDAVRQAILAGLNVRTEFTHPGDYVYPLRELVREGKVSIEILDERVSDVLRVKYWLGLFDKPYIENPELADKIVASEEHQKISYEASQKSIVLLKNNNKLLPLKKNIKSILVTGPNADAISSSISRYGPSKVDIISVLQGIIQKLGDNVDIKYTKGCEILDSNFPESEIIPSEPNEDEIVEIEKAKSMAKDVEVAIVVIGDDESIVGESKSRTSLELTGFQLELVKAIYETGTPTVVVLINGRPLTINWIDKNIPAIVEAWFPGKWGGAAVADVLFGDYNPGGKLPVTFPKSVGQIPLNFPYKPSSDLGDKTSVRGVLYPFGFGLSYTEFEYSDLQLTPTKQQLTGNIEVSLAIENIGEIAGDEVVQLYINDETSSVTTYVKQLKGFKRIFLEPGAKQSVSFTLSPDDLKLINRNNEFLVEPGKFNVMLGSSSEDIRLNGEFYINE